jgi:hypothetical protein
MEKKIPMKKYTPRQKQILIISITASLTKLGHNSLFKTNKKRPVPHAIKNILLIKYSYYEFIIEY